MNYFRILADRTQDNGTVEVRFWSDAVSEEDAAIQRAPDGSILRCHTDLNILLPDPIPGGLTRDAYILRFARQVLPS
jgi:hypothetical protein